MCSSQTHLFIPIATEYYSFDSYIRMLIMQLHHLLPVLLKILLFPLTFLGCLIAPPPGDCYDLTPIKDKTLTSQVPHFRPL
jgi:hypothetical protein